MQHSPHHVLALGTHRLIALTNNFSAAEPLFSSAPPPGFTEKYSDFISVAAEVASLGWDDGVVPHQLRALFDDFCDSSLLGMRQVQYVLSGSCANHNSALDT
jgi:hypothetical protein